MRQQHQPREEFRITIAVDGADADADADAGDDSIDLFYLFCFLMDHSHRRNNLPMKPMIK